MTNNGNGSGWGLKEKVLTSFGMTLIGASWVNADVLGHSFHMEFVLAGLAFCGVAIAQWGDRR